MNVGELITRLSTYRPDLEVAILDNFSGQPRTINLGPHLEGDEVARDMGYPKTDRDYTDLKTYQGNLIVIMGYGCY